MVPIKSHAKITSKMRGLNPLVSLASLNNRVDVAGNFQTVQKSRKIVKFRDRRLVATAEFGKIVQF
jgi:hypothetical protein